MNLNKEKLEWDIRVPIFKNSIIMKQIGLGIGIPFGILLTVLFIMSFSSRDSLYGLYLVLILLGLTVILVLILFNGTYDVSYKIDKEGITCRNQQKQTKRIKTMSKITFFAGLFTGNVTAAGAGLLAGSKTNSFIRWRNVRKFKHKPKNRAIMISDGYLDNIAIFCTEENYEAVRDYVDTFMKNK